MPQVQPPNTADEIDQYLTDLDRRLELAQAQAAEQYQQARDALAAHHGQMDAKARELQDRKAKLEPAVEAFLHGDGSKLDPSIARACLEYLKVCAALGNALQARRIGYGATLPPGEHAPERRWEQDQ